MTVSVLKSFERLFAPTAIAIAGMSTTRKGPANRYLQELRNFGYAGQIFAIHPSADEIDGVRAYRSFGELPSPVDYAYVAVPAKHLLELIGSANQQVGFAQVMTSGLGEGSAEGKELQNQLVDVARREGVRIIGPNCLGTYSPRGRVNFVSDASKVPGTVGVISQSGGLGFDIVRRGKQRGLDFSGLVTVGNSADVDPVELVEYYLSDPSTSVIGMYLEDIKRGRRLFEFLTHAKGRKPCVILKGGMSSQGAAAAVSHTGAMVSDGRVWTALSRQTGALLTETVDEFVDALVCLQHLQITPGRITRNVALVGNGGGSSVLASDAFAQAALRVSSLTDAAIDSLEGLALPPGTSLVNPVDLPAGTMLQQNGAVMQDILRIVGGDDAVDAVVAHFNLTVLAAYSDDVAGLVSNLEDAIVSARSGMPRSKHLVTVLRTDGNATIDEVQSRLVRRLADRGIPVVRELADAAVTIGRIAGLETSWNRALVGEP